MKMPKAILELPEMPESCWKCKYCTIFDVCSILSKRGKSDTYAIVPGEGRHKDCPLKLVEDKEVE
jgi:hypothetical protein